MIDKKALIEECLNLSIQYLKRNSTENGLLAATPSSLEGDFKNYDSLFSRDIGVCTLGILLSQDPELIQSIKISLENLISIQSDLGQVPFYYKPQQSYIHWRSAGSLDSNLWWAIGFLQYYKYTHDEDFYNKYKDNLESLFTWLRYQDSNNDYLLEQGEAADWADEMPRRGSVLYTNTLWYFLLTLRIEIEQRDDLIFLKEKIYESFNTVFWIHKKSSSNLNYIPLNSLTSQNKSIVGILEKINSEVVFLPYYIGFVSHKSYETRCDVFGNILACLFGLADSEKLNTILTFINNSPISIPYPVKALYPPIYPGEHDWQTYMTKERQNYPYQYHNGGIWPCIGAFYVELLARTNKEKAINELYRLALANKKNNWEFNEYLHGETGIPMGIPHQSWNMAMFISAYKNIFKDEAN